MIKASSHPPSSFDVVIYGGTCAGIAAAVAADRMGLRTALLSPDDHLGGLTSNGLGWTDSKDGSAVGGISREFYHRIWQYYRDPSVWRLTQRDDYARRWERSQPGKTVDDEQQVMWTFEPQAAEAVFDTWMEETSVTVRRGEWLDRDGGVDVRDGRITQIRMLSGNAYAAKVFIDASYEGDLMAAAGVTYRIGRDSAAEFGESLNGIYFKAPGARYNNDEKYADISPYNVPGDPASGFIAGVEGDMPDGEKLGDADRRLQSFCYRLCLTQLEANRAPITRPEGYDERQYEILLRLFEAGHPSGFTTQEMPNGKTDSNNQGMVSFDFLGGSAGYSDGTYEHRRQIADNHRRYQLGLLWTLQNHPRVPEDQRRQFAPWGLAADEFTDNGHWPRQLYVREARRMTGQAIMTQHHVELRDPVADSIGLGSYSLDSHGVRRVVVDGKIRVEGGFYVWHDKAYPISYGSIVPKRGECANLLVPVTLSATHAAFGSIRMEPTYMILGHSAAAAAKLAIEGDAPVQDVPYEPLKKLLLEQRQVLRP